jgi:hypothetical protein
MYDEQYSTGWKKVSSVLVIFSLFFVKNFAFFGQPEWGIA